MWTRLDDGIFDNPKVLRAGPKACLLYIASLVYCSRNLTDGFIPKPHIYKLVPWFEPKAVGQLAPRLVGSKLWATARQRGQQGYRIHDYLDYNFSRKTVLNKRERDRVRKRFRAESAADSTVSRTRPVPKDINPPTPLSKGGDFSQTKRAEQALDPEARRVPSVAQTKAYLEALQIRIEKGRH